MVLDAEKEENAGSTKDDGALKMELDAEGVQSTMEDPADGLFLPCRLHIPWG